MYYLGIDFHKAYSVLHLTDSKGLLVKKQKLYNRRQHFQQFLKDIQPVCAVVEACRNWPVIIELLDGLVDHIKLAHPFKVKAIAEARIKNDTIDSETLCHLLRADLIPEAYLRPATNRDDQKVLRNRSFWIKVRTQCKNRIHTLVDQQSEEIRESSKQFSDLFGKKGICWLYSLNLKQPDQDILNDLLDLEENLKKKIQQSDRRIKEIYQSDEECQLLKSIPGIGHFFSVLIKTEIGDISRFKTSDKLCSYAGLVPSSYGSGGRVYHGRITKNGNKWLRWAMIEAVLPAICNHTELRYYYDSLKQRKGSNTAKVATARRLLCIVHRVLKQKTEFYETRHQLKQLYSGVAIKTA